MEDDATRIGVSRRDYSGRRQRAAVDVGSDPFERDEPLERAPQGRRVEQSRQARAGQASEQRARPQQTAELGRGHQRTQRIAPPQLTPHLDRGRGHRLKRLIRSSSEERTVERTDAGPDHDVRCLAGRRERRRQRVKRTHLVSTPRPTAG